MEQSVQQREKLQQTREAMQSQPDDAYNAIMDIAQSVFNIDSVRPQQLSVIEAMLRRQDTVASRLSPHN